MVRFIISSENLQKAWAKKFTFQYGQIYYGESDYNVCKKIKIYIPIWLDLL